MLPYGGLTAALTWRAQRLVRLTAVEVAHRWQVRLGRIRAESLQSMAVLLCLHQWQMYCQLQECSTAYVLLSKWQALQPS